MEESQDSYFLRRRPLWSRNRGHLPEVLLHERCYIDVRKNLIKDVIEEGAKFILAFGP